MSGQKVHKNNLREMGRKVLYIFNRYNFGVLILASLLLTKLFWGNVIKGEDLKEVIKTSVSVLITMLGFSVSAYVFLNNTFQNKRSANTVEREIIKLFQDEKRKSLSTSVIFSIAAIFIECWILAWSDTCIDRLSAREMLETDNLWKFVCYCLILLVIFLTLYNVIRLGTFTYGIINYEEGLRNLAKEKIEVYKGTGQHEAITKGEFLNLVNNIEVLVERLVRNHVHAKGSTMYDTDLKRALCDGITEPGEISQREEIAELYRNMVDYRNLLLQNSDMEDSTQVDQGDEIKNIANQMFEKYLKGELLTGININNLNPIEAHLEKTSFSNSSLNNIKFIGKTNLKNTDFRNSTIQNMSFDDNKQTDCESVNFSDCKLIDIRLDVQVILCRAIFKNADLTGMGRIGTTDKEGEKIRFEHADFSNANLTFQNIYNANLCYTDFSDARLTDSKIGEDALKKDNVIFEYSNLERADFLRAVITRTDFTNANLKMASCTDAKLRDCNFEGARLYSANFTNANIGNCRFEKTYCTEMTVKSASLSDCLFNYAVLTGVDMSGATITKAEFRDAICRDTLWINTQIEECDFERSVLANARIVGDSGRVTRIRKCNFKYADMSNMAITNVEFETCDFYGVDFYNTRLINVKFINCSNLRYANRKDMWLVDVSTDGGENDWYNTKYRYLLSSNEKEEDI